MIRIIILFTLFSLQIAYAFDGPSKEIEGTQDEQSFPFDKQCLTFDQSNFKVGQPLLDVMITADFPQYCTLYSLSKYQVKQKRDEGYFIIQKPKGTVPLRNRGQSPSVSASEVESTIVYLKSKKAYQNNQLLSASGPAEAEGDSPLEKQGTVLFNKPLKGQWAYFTGLERFVMIDGSEKEFYVFQEIDF